MKANLFPVIFIVTSFVFCLCFPKLNGQAINLRVKSMGKVNIERNQLIIKDLLIENTGPATITRMPCRIAFYLSKDKRISTFDHFVGSEQLPRLIPGGTFSKSFSTQISGIKPGYYYLGIVIDDQQRVRESNELDNKAIYPKLFWIGIPGKHLSVANPGTLTIEKGWMNVPGLQIVNDGTETIYNIQGKNDVYMDLSLTLDTSLTYLPTAPFATYDMTWDSLAPGMKYEFNIYESIRSALIDLATKDTYIYRHQSGNYFLGVELTVDPSRSSNYRQIIYIVYDSPEIKAGPLPNLRLPSSIPVTIQRNYLKIGDYKIKNDGDAASPKSTVQYYLKPTSSNSALQTLANVDIPPIAAGDSLNVNLMYPLRNIKADEFYILVGLDPQHQVMEWYEGDNRDYAQKVVLNRNWPFKGTGFGLPTQNPPIKNDNLQLHPNPSNGRFEVKLNNTNVHNPSQLSLIDSYGKKLKVINVQPGQLFHQQFDLSDQPSGIYFIQVKTEEGIQVKKLVLNK